MLLGCEDGSLVRSVDCRHTVHMKSGLYLTCSFLVLYMCTSFSRSCMMLTQHVVK